MKMTSEDYEDDTTNFSQDSSFNNVHVTDREYTDPNRPSALGELRFKLKVAGNPDNFNSLDPKHIKDMYILCYTSN